MYVSSRQGYKPPVKSIGKVKEYSHFASLKYCNGAETFYTVSYHAYIPLLKFNNIVMNSNYSAPHGMSSYLTVLQQQV